MGVLRRFQQERAAAARRVEHNRSAEPVDGPRHELRRHVGWCVERAATAPLAPTEQSLVRSTEVVGPGAIGYLDRRRLPREQCQVARQPDALPSRQLDGGSGELIAWGYAASESSGHPAKLARRGSLEKTSTRGISSPSRFCSCLTSSSWSHKTSVATTPDVPARAVRPERCRYDLWSDGGS